MQVDEALLEGHLGITRELLAFTSAERKFNIGSENGGSNLIRVSNAVCLSMRVLSMVLLLSFEVFFSLFQRNALLSFKKKIDMMHVLVVIQISLVLSFFFAVL